MTVRGLSILLTLGLLACGDKDGGDSGGIDADGDGVVEADDCDDNDADAYPGNTETCDGVDNDCDGVVDNDLLITVYADEDGDGHGAGTASEVCEVGVGEAESDDDCDDANADIHPGAPEDDCADPVDYNCDGSVAYADADGDGFAACEDCDDNNSSVNPDAVEECDFIDNDCDGDTDEGDAVDASSWYADLDGDGYGDPANSVDACEMPSGFLADDSDCDDTSADVYPGAPEVCDGQDSDCDGTVGETLVPTDEPNIQDALDNSSDGDIVCVEPGTYVENLSFPEWDLWLQSIEGSATTILQGDGTGSVIQTGGAQTGDTLVDGFSITGGGGDFGAAIAVLGGSPVMTNLDIYDNALAATQDRGGAVYVLGGDLTLLDSAIHGHSLVGQVFAFGSALTVDDGSDVYLEGVSIYDNDMQVSASFGAVGCYGGSAPSALTMQNVSITDNSAVVASQGTGSAVGTAYCDTDLTNVIIAGNQSTMAGGTDYGGAAFFGFSGSATLTNVAVVGNDSSQSSEETIYTPGVGFYVVATTMVNTDISGNSAGGSGAEAMSCIAGDTYAGSYGNLYDNATGGTVCTNSDGTGMTSTDPLYTDTSATDARDWDFTLGTGSGLIDAGDPGITDADGTTSDIGALGGPGGASW